MNNFHFLNCPLCRFPLGGPRAGGPVNVCLRCGASIRVLEANNLPAGLLPAGPVPPVAQELREGRSAYLKFSCQQPTALGQGLVGGCLLTCVLAPMALLTIMPGMFLLDDQFEQVSMAIAFGSALCGAVFAVLVSLFSRPGVKIDAVQADHQRREVVVTRNAEAHEDAVVVARLSFDCFSISQAHHASVFDSSDEYFAYTGISLHLQLEGLDRSPEGLCWLAYSAPSDPADLERQHAAQAIEAAHIARAMGLTFNPEVQARAE